MNFGHIPGQHFIFPTVYNTTKRNLDVVIWLEDLVVNGAQQFIITASSFPNAAKWRAECMAIRLDVEDALEANGRLGELRVTLGRGLRTFRLSASQHGRDAYAAVSKGYVWNSADRCIDVEQTKSIWFGLLEHLTPGNDSVNLHLFSQFGPMNDPPIPELTNEVAFAKLRVLG